MLMPNPWPDWPSLGKKDGTRIAFIPFARKAICTVDVQMLLT
jgi:hypothetical protein